MFGRVRQGTQNIGVGRSSLPRIGRAGRAENDGSSDNGINCPTNFFNQLALLPNIKKLFRSSVLSPLAWLLFLAFANGAPATAHTPAGHSVSAFQFPDLLVPTVDGDLSDWDIVSNEYAIHTDLFVDLVKGASVDSDDLSVRLMVGWNQTLNRIFVAARVVDDIHQVDRPAGTASTRIFQDDDMEVFIDADHSGGQYANFAELSPEEQLRMNGASANHFVLAGPPPDGDFFVNFSAAGWYSRADGIYTGAAVAFESSSAGTITTYEMMVSPFDTVHMDAAILSTEHRMVEEEIIGFNVEFGDFDANSLLLDAKWSLSGAQNSFRFADRFTDLHLMPLRGLFAPTGVGATSWGRIKAQWPD